ncbi:adenylyl-sulfate kinase, partial [Arthrobacter sp. RIT-PI-e]|uniref:adenylyl-sulfate kinase n=1 Tax=Arthrobacter sp. RIT-PI-e TaxID=1681197 RepID=UPI00128EA967
MRILLTGIDGSGKSTAARELQNAIHDQGHEAMMLKTAGGRKTTTGWWEALGWAPSTRWQDRIE